MASNIKGAPAALTPAKVEQMLGWMDVRKAAPILPNKPMKGTKNG